MRKLIDYIAKFELALGALLLAIFVITTLIQVISRYLNISVTWTEELSVNAFIWSMLLGAAVMTRYKKHFSFSYLKNSVKNEKYKKVISLLQNFLILFFSLTCLIYSIEITELFWNSKWITIPSFKQGYVWLILPFIFSSIAIFVVEDIVDQSLYLVGNKK